jgi:hypothetical protein
VKNSEADLLAGYFYNLAARLLVFGTGIVKATLGANPVRELALVALRALGLRHRFQEIVGAPAAGAALGMASFWIRHVLFSSVPQFTSRD